MKQIELFFWGIIAALGALLVEILFSFSMTAYANPDNILDFNLFNSSLLLVVSFVLVEEMFKYLIIVKKVELFSLERSYIFNSLIVGLGFATTELTLIALQNNGSLENFFSLGRVAIVHISTAGIMGYLVALGNPNRLKTFFWAITLSSILHLAYNLLILNQDKLAFSEQVINTLVLLLIYLNISNIIRLPKKLAS